jgi:hypothetical protein
MNGMMHVNDGEPDLGGRLARLQAVLNMLPELALGVGGRRNAPPD